MPVETGSLILDALRRFASLLVLAENELNALNVFPVADRDTGTNLRRTMERLVDELDGVAAGEPFGSAAAVAALEAARGNSGLICSQFVASFVAGFASGPRVDGACLARGLEEGARAARAAVGRPVEGTMLTVADAVATAVGAEPDSATVAEIAAVAHRRAIEALDATTGQLAVLAAAGVVDAGAAGLVLFYQSLAEVFGGETMGMPSAVVASKVAAAIGPARFVGFELQFTADGPTALADELRMLLAAVGTDVVVSSADDLVRAHVHAKDLGPVLEAVIACTRPRNIVVEALMESTEP